MPSHGLSPHLTSCLSFPLHDNTVPHRPLISTQPVPVSPEPCKPFLQPLSALLQARIGSHPVLSNYRPFSHAVTLQLLHTTLLPSCTLQAHPSSQAPKEDEHAIIMHATCSISSNPSSPARLLSLQLCKACHACKPRDGRKQDMQGNAIESIPVFLFPERVSVILAGPERSVAGGSPVRRTPYLQQTFPSNLHR
jgi:hypothetical protein